MFRSTPRVIARSANSALSQRSIAPSRRFLSTAPPTQRSRSWKSLAARVGIAGTLIYYYNTTDVFAEEPRHMVQTLPETETESEHLLTIESISAERQKRKAVQAQLEAQQAQQQESAARQQDGSAAAGASGGEGGIEGLEEEAGQQGAFNPETGEINWDCPCLGGMATGPCGEQFKAAFSCFVYSTEEPKGMDCIDRFKDMQNCFREYPEVYGSELEGDEEDEQPAPSSSAAPAYNESATPAPSSAPTKSATSSSHESASAEKGKQSAESHSKPASSSTSSLALVPDNYKPEKEEEPVSESESLVPKAAHDSREEGTGVLERK